VTLEVALRESVLRCPVGAIYLDKPGELARYNRAFAEIWQISLDEDTSRDFISTAAEALKDG
jgi:Domain of unknown function (DUF5753)